MLDGVCLIHGELIVTIVLFYNFYGILSVSSAQYLHPSSVTDLRNKFELGHNVMESRQQGLLFMNMEKGRMRGA